MDQQGISHIYIARRFQEGRAVGVSGFYGLESETLAFIRGQFPHWPWSVLWT